MLRSGRLTEIACRKRRGFSPSREAGFSGLSPCFWPAGRGHSFHRQGVFCGHSPVDRLHRRSCCRQYGSAGTPPSRQAVPVAVVPVPPIRLPRRSREPAGLQPKRSVRRLGQRRLGVRLTGKRLVAQMPEPFLPGRLISLRLALHRGTCALFPFLGADHDPAFGALRQIGLPLAPSVACPVRAALPALPDLGVLGILGRLDGGVQPFVHTGMRGARDLGHTADPPTPAALSWDMFSAL